MWRREPRTGGRRWALAGVAGLLVAATSGLGLLTGGPAGAASGSAPGVTSTSISTGAITTLTGPLASNFASLVPGIQAYFDMVNAQGGINGRKLVLSHSLDDGGNPSQFNQLAHTLVDQDHVFAVVGVATAFFSPNYLVQTKTPTYGYNVVGNWAGPPNLFAAGGSVQYYPAGALAFSYLAQHLKAKSVAVVSYGIASSQNSCKATIQGFKDRGINVSYTDLNIPYPGSGVASDVQRMQQAKVDFVISCMDVTGNIAMARAIQQYGLKTNQLWLSGNDQPTLDQYPDLMKGVYFSIAHVPYLAPQRIYPGLSLFLKTMQKYEPKYANDEVAIQGWQSAALFAAGVKAAGNNLTQQNVINQTNKMTSFTADGLTYPVNWVKGGHSGVTYPVCNAYIQVQGKKFVPVLGQGKQVFVCFNPSPHKVPKLATPPPGTPGA